MSALGLAAMLPSLVLQRVAVRPDTLDSNPVDTEPASAVPADERARAQDRVDPHVQGANGAGPLAEDEGRLPAANGTADAGPSEAGDQASRPRRIRANPARRRSGSEPTPTDSASTAVGSTVEHDDDGSGSAMLPEVAGEAEGTPKAARTSREDRRLARVRQRQDAKAKRREEDKDRPQNLPPISYEDGQAAHVAMVRHVNALTVSLNEAHRIIGRLNMERYQAQHELAIVKKLPLPPPLPDPSWNRGSQSGPHTVRQLQRNKSKDQAPELDLEELTRIRTSIKRRRVIVAGSVALLVGTIVLYRTMGWTWFPDISDRESMTQLAGIGAFVQIFFIGWIFFRFARMGGKGARWLFPDVEEEHRKQRRKQRP